MIFLRVLCDQICFEVTLPKVLSNLVPNSPPFSSFYSLDFIEFCAILCKIYPSSNFTVIYHKKVLGYIWFNGKFRNL